MTLLVTGATGNVGRAVISALGSSTEKVYAGVRNPEKIISDPFYKNTRPIAFDLLNFNAKTIPPDIDVVFLMRPPQIADPTVFINLINHFKAQNAHILFLSIQNADKKEFTPHRKIEHIIINSGVRYTFIRPSYFMDNLTTTFLEEIKNNRRILMPSGNLQFNWIDVADIGEIIWHIANNSNTYQNTSLEITGSESLSFSEVVAIINKFSKANLSYISPMVISFIGYSLSKKMKISYVLVLLLLHWIPKFEKPTPLTDTFKKIMGRKPRRVEDFVKANISFFENR